MVQLEENNDHSNSRIHLERKTVDYVDYTEVFTGDNESYTRQFASLYMKRIEEFTPVLKKRVHNKWGDVPIKPLAGLENHRGKCVIIGTLYKHQPNKPSVLQELSDDHQLTLPPPKIDYCSDEDQLFLEDQTSRIKLSGSNVHVKESVTGVVCAILGQENAQSSFEVEGWCFAGCPSPDLNPSTPVSGKIVFLSGLDLAKSPTQLPLSLFLEWVQGFAGCRESQEETADIVRVIIAGNCIKSCADTHISKGLVSGRAEDEAAARDMTRGIQKLDDLLSTLGRNCAVTFMPGQFDVTTFMMPQRPMHPGSFPRAKRLSTIKGATNPWIGKIGDKTVIGTSGQPIQDMKKVCGANTLKSIEHLEKTLEWRHLCPTAPDTIPSLPFNKCDPFIIRECPDIYFAGNMDSFDTKIHLGSEGQKIRLVCIPQFSTSQTAVIVDLSTLDTVPICFGSS